MGALVGDPEEQLGQRDRHGGGDRGEQLLVVEPGQLAGRGQHERGVGAVAADQSGRLLQRGQLSAGRGTGQRQGRGHARPGREPVVLDRGVHGVLRHPAVRRQLAAHDRRHARRAGHDGVPTRQVGGGAVAAVQQRPQPGEGSDHVGAVQRPRERGGHDVEQEADLGLGRLRHVRDRAGGGLVGEADVHRAVGLGEDHHEAVGLAGDGREDTGPQAGQRVGAQHQVGAAAGAQPDAVAAAALLAEDLVGPHAGGVDDGAGAHGVLDAGDLVAQDHLAAGGVQHAPAGADVGAVVGGGAPHRHDQAGVVLELAVPAEQAAAQPGGSQRGHHRQRLGRRHVARLGQRLGVGAGATSQQVAGAQAGPGEPALQTRHRGGDGDDHRHRPGQVGRGDLHQDAALDGALVRDPDLPLGEVAQSAVHHLRAPARGAEGEVVGVHGQHRQAARHGVERHPGAGDAQAHDEDVDLAGGPGEAGPDHDAPPTSPRVSSSRSSSSSASASTSASTIVCADSTNP